MTRGRDGGQITPEEAAAKLDEELALLDSNVAMRPPSLKDRRQIGLQPFIDAILRHRAREYSNKRKAPQAPPATARQVICGAAPPSAFGLLGGGLA